MKAAKLEIIMNEKGDIQVTGPIDQKYLCYGMLECARDSINDYHHARREAAQQPTIVRPGLADTLKLNGHGKRGPS